MNIEDIEKLSQEYPIIIYDGVCVFCNRFISFVNKVDRGNLFRFATLQGEAGLAIKDKVLHATRNESVLFLYKGEYKMYSAVGFHVFYLLGYPYRFLYPLIYIPAFIRDWFYHILAKNRYSWFGKTETCELPERSFRDKIIS